MIEVVVAGASSEGSAINRSNGCVDQAVERRAP